MKSSAKTAIDCILSEVSTWEFSFSLDFHSSPRFYASCNEKASLLFLKMAQTSGSEWRRIRNKWKKTEKKRIYTAWKPTNKNGIERQKKNGKMKKKNMDEQTKSYYNKISENESWNFVKNIRHFFASAKMFETFSFRRMVVFSVCIDAKEEMYERQVSSGDYGLVSKHERASDWAGKREKTRQRQRYCVKIKELTSQIHVHVVYVLVSPFQMLYNIFLIHFKSKVLCRRREWRNRRSKREKKKESSALL